MTAPGLWCVSDGCRGRCEEAGHRLTLDGFGAWRRAGCTIHRRCTAYTPAASEDGTAGVGGGPGEAPAATAGHLPGAQPAPTPGVVAASPPEDGQPAAEVSAPASAAGPGQLLLAGTTWYCPACLAFRELPRRCCNTDLIEAEIVVRRKVRG